MRQTFGYADSITLQFSALIIYISLDLGRNIAGQGLQGLISDHITDLSHLITL